MGCDIHMYVERRHNRYGGGKTEWLCGDYFSIKNPLDPECRPVLQELWGDRWYELFAVLANVRNGHGEAAQPYIDLPRGIPDDATEYVKDEYRLWDDDAHSSSYFTLKELIEFQLEHRPISHFGAHDILEPIIESLKKRAADFNIISEFEWNREWTDELRDKMDNIRIVFWFDN